MNKMILSKIRFSIILLNIILILSNCAPKISNLHQYNKQNFPKTSFMPSKESVKGAPPKVVIFNFNENNNKVAIDANLGKSLAVNIENLLTKDRLVQLIDRKIATKLEKEILLSQINNEDVAYNGPPVANYAISGEIGSAGFNKKYSSGMMLYSKDRGLYKTPAKFKYSSEVKGNVKVYEIPSMDVIDNFKISGFAKRSENVQKSGGVSIAGLIEVGVEKNKGLEADNDLVRKAGENAIYSSSTVIKNAFAKKGYVLEKRSFKNKVIFKVSLGERDGIKHGDRFEIIGKFEIENPITNEVEIEKRILGEGRVSNRINPKYSFVVLNKKEYNNMVRLGDIVQIKYKKSLSQKISKFNRYVPN